tara:strand:+ start:4404 stop:5537 length:1134 start_codon:yes stop_codon:yes gene_type:complete
MARGGEVLPDWRIQELIDEGFIINADPSLINSSSLDLRTGNSRWKLLGGFLPSKGQKVKEALKSLDIVDAVNSTKEDFFVELSQPYLVNLVESLDLLDIVTAKIHNKSGRGRIGISLKGLVDKVSRFDFIPGGYKGGIYAEICTTAFPIVIQAGETAIPQIRFYNGDPQPLQGIDLDSLLRHNPILTDLEGNPTYDKKAKMEIIRTGSFTFHADLSGELLAYKANKDARNLVLSKKNHYDPENYFEPVIKRSDRKEGAVVIHPGEFILVKSKENIRLPPEIAAEISDYSSDLGDIRSHYAGLINAGHGYDPENPDVPSHIVFEVRARDLPFVLRDNQRLAKVEVYRMLDEPKQSYMAKRSTDFNDLKSFLPGIFNKD